VGKQIKIVVGNSTFSGVLNETKTAKAILSALPISAQAQTWGEEIYFSIPMEPVEEPNQEEVEIGDLGYWPPGKAFCIFFGRTPASTSDKPRAASAVIVIGKVKGGVEKLKNIKSGDMVRIDD